MTDEDEPFETRDTDPDFSHERVTSEREDLVVLAVTEDVVPGTYTTGGVSTETDAWGLNVNIPEDPSHAAHVTVNAPPEEGQQEETATNEEGVTFEVSQSAFHYPVHDREMARWLAKFIMRHGGEYREPGET